MKMKLKLAAFTVCLLGIDVTYAQTEVSTDERIAALEEKITILMDEVEKDWFGDVIPELTEGVHGMGPSASKIYSIEQGLSIGGYGELLYSNNNGRDNTKTDSFDMVRAVLYFGYKFNDKWVLNTEFEFEHADTVFVEFAYLDYLHTEGLNFRGGLVLAPIGIQGELHEPSIVLGATRTTVETRIIPTTWRENGGGIFGDLGSMSYKLYLMTSLDGGQFDAAGIRGGRQKGSSAKAEDFSIVARADWRMTPTLSIGGSLYGGQQGQDSGADGDFFLAETHLTLRKGAFTVNALVTATRLGDAQSLNAANIAAGNIVAGEEAGEAMFGWYTELGYDLLASSDIGELQLTPFVRLEQVDTQSKVASGSTVDAADYDLDIVTVGLNFKPIDEVVFKLEHQFIRDGNNAQLDRTNFGMGYVF